jgi:hypothetical protein
MLLALHMLALGVVTIIFLGMIALHRRARIIRQMMPIDGGLLSTVPPFMPRPATWLAIRSSNPKAVQAVLALSDTARCPWTEGIAGKSLFFWQD